MSKNKGGRRSKYHTHVEPKLFEIECWARDGLIDEQIAKNLGVAYSTFRTYINKFPALSAALKKGKEIIDYEVENALLKRALGYEFEEQTYIAIEMNQDEYDLRVDIELAIWNRNNPNATQDERDRFIMSIPRTKEILEKKVVKQVAPDTTAQIFWLKNRKPDKWRDKQDIQHSGDMNVNHNPYADLSTEDLKKLIKDD